MLYDGCGFVCDGVICFFEVCVLFCVFDFYEVDVVFGEFCCGDFVGVGFRFCLVYVLCVDEYVGGMCDGYYFCDGCEVWDDEWFD